MIANVLPPTICLPPAAVTGGGGVLIACSGVDDGIRMKKSDAQGTFE